MVHVEVYYDTPSRTLMGNDTTLHSKVERTCPSVPIDWTLSSTTTYSTLEDTGYASLPLEVLCCLTVDGNEIKWMDSDGSAWIYVRTETSMRGIDVWMHQRGIRLLSEEPAIAEIPPLPSLCLDVLKLAEISQLNPDAIDTSYTQLNNTPSTHPIFQH